MSKRLLYFISFVILFNLSLLFPVNNVQAGCYCTNSPNPNCTIGGTCDSCIPAQAVCAAAGFSSECATGSGVDNGSGGCQCNTVTCTNPPTNTPIPSKTPTPRPTKTPTPTPTRTPTPTLTATPTTTPTPTLNPSFCECDSVTYDNFAGGQTSNFIAKAKVNSTSHPDVKVDRIIFHVEQDTGSGLTPLVTSAPIIPAGPTPISGYNYYEASWSYNIPAPPANTTLEYKVWDEITCAYNVASLPIGQNVAGMTTTTNPASFWQQFIQFLNSIFNFGKNKTPEASLPKNLSTNNLSSRICQVNMKSQSIN